MIKAVPNQGRDILTLTTDNNEIKISGKLNINDKPQLNIDFIIRMNEFVILYTHSSISICILYIAFCVIPKIVSFSSETPVKVHL